MNHLYATLLGAAVILIVAASLYCLSDLMGTDNLLTLLVLLGASWITGMLLLLRREARQ